VSQRFAVAFADPVREVEGVAIAGAGTLLARAGELTAAAPPALGGGGGAWTLAAAGALELGLTALAAAATLPGGEVIWLCRAKGVVGTEGLDALATLTEAPAAELALTRSLAIPFDDSLAFALVAKRRPGVAGHGGEELDAVVFRGEPLAAAAIAKPRLSTTYDGAGLPMHAGIELWESEEAEFALRIGGEALISGELVAADGARSLVVFMAFHHESHRAVGSYTITTVGGGR
jgi:hypothetical protein